MNGVFPGVLGVAFAGFAGLLCGALASLAGQRMACDQPLFGGQAHCPSCQAPLGIGDQFALLSWLSSRGRCSRCGQPLRPGDSVIAGWPFVEAVVAALFILVYLERGATAPGFLLAALAVGLAMVSIIDLEIGIIPDKILVVLAPLGVIYSVTGGDRALDDVVTSLIGGAFAGSLAFAVHYGFKRLRGREGLGLGDVKFFAVAGLWLGPFGLPAFMIVSGVSGVAFAMLWRRLGGGREFPFGPALALGLFLCLLFPALVRLFG
ncbi:MAG: prepilin peptidase [Proteobacteria bacterium]|nr:prepilin peptidase [Pseudomonadota bacterium]